MENGKSIKQLLGNGKKTKSPKLIIELAEFLKKKIEENPDLWNRIKEDYHLIDLSSASRFLTNMEYELDQYLNFVENYVETFPEEFLIKRNYSIELWDKIRPIIEKWIKDNPSR